SCSRSVQSCASASAALRSPWHPPVRSPKIGPALQFGSRLPPCHAPRQHDTESRDAAPSQAHRDQLIAAPRSPEMSQLPSRLQTPRQAVPPKMQVTVLSDTLNHERLA